MRYTKLGSTDLTVSRVCMGCMGFGDPDRGQHSWTVDEEHTRVIVRRGLELGVSFYDTAIAYQSGTRSAMMPILYRFLLNRKNYSDTVSVSILYTYSDTMSIYF